MNESAAVTTPVVNAGEIGETRAIVSEDTPTTIDRPISDNVRKVFAERMAERRAKEEQIAKASTGLSPAEPEPAAKPAEPVPDPAAAAPAEPEPTKAEPAKDIAAIVAQRHAAQLELREQALAKREAEIEARAAEVAAKMNGRSAYAQKPAETIRNLVKEWTGADGDELREEVADLITELSSSMLGVPVPDTHKTRAESRKAIRTVNAWKAEAAEAEAKAKAAQQSAAQQASEANAVRVIASHITPSKFPDLADEPNAADVVFDLIKRSHADHVAQHGHDRGFVPDVIGAATEADKFFKQRNDAAAAKLSARRTLTAPPAPAAPAPAPSQPVHQGERQGARSSTLTHADATAVVPPAPPPVPEGPYDREQATKALLAKYREKFKAARQ